MPSFDLNNLQLGKTYNVKVRALDAQGNYSPYSLNYRFTVPIFDPVTASQLSGINNTTVTLFSANTSGVPVGGALTAGGLDTNGVSYAGILNLASVWNSGSNGYVTNASVTGSPSAGAVLINSTGILGYQFAASPGFSSTASGQPNFYLSTQDGNAYFRGTIFAKAGQFTGSLSAGTMAIGANIAGTTASGLVFDQYNYWLNRPSLATASFRMGGPSNYVIWDSSTLNIYGSVTATQGNIAGFNLTASGLYYVEPLGTRIPWKNPDVGYSDQMTMDTFSGKITTLRQYTSTASSGSYNDDDTIYASIEPGYLKTGKRNIRDYFRGKTASDDGTNRTWLSRNYTSAALQNGINSEGSDSRWYLWTPSSLNDGSNTYGYIYTYVDTDNNMRLKMSGVGNSNTYDSYDSYLEFVSNYTDYVIKSASISNPGGGVLPKIKYTIAESYGTALQTLSSGAVAKIYTLSPHPFVSTDKILVSGVGSPFDGLQTVNGLTQGYILFSPSTASNVGFKALSPYATIEYYNTSITGKKSSGTSASITVPSGHGFIPGDYVYIIGVDSNFNSASAAITASYSTVLVYTLPSASTVAQTTVSPAGTIMYASKANALGGKSNEIAVLYTPQYYITNKQVPSLNTASLTTSASHNLSTGQVVIVSGLGSPYDGTFTLTNTTAGTTILSYAVTSGVLANAICYPYGQVKYSNSGATALNILDYQFPMGTPGIRSFTSTVGSSIIAKQISSSVATIWLSSTVIPFGVGHSITIVGEDATFNGTYTITDMGSSWIKFSLSAANVGYTAGVGTGVVSLSGLVDNTTYSNVIAVGSNALYRKTSTATLTAGASGHIYLTGDTSETVHIYGTLSMPYNVFEVSCSNSAGTTTVNNFSFGYNFSMVPLVMVSLRTTVPNSCAIGTDKPTTTNGITINSYRTTSTNTIVTCFVAGGTGV